MKVSCPVSLGELVDKMSILSIKLEKIVDATKRQKAQEELEALSAIHLSLPKKVSAQYFRALRMVNSELWEVEDLLREREKNQDFGHRFVELARSVYYFNDKRFEIKNEINQVYGSEFVEVKSYGLADYQRTQHDKEESQFTQPQREV